MKRRLALALLAPLILGACAETSTGPGPGTAALDGRTFVSASVSGHTLVADSTITLTFNGNQLGAYAGCNHLSGDFSVKDGVLHVGSVGGTEMACLPQSRMDQDDWLVGFLTEGPSLVLTGDVLTLTENGTTLVLSEQHVINAPLEETSWELDGLITGEGSEATVSSVPSTVRGAGMRIESGQLSIDTGVNTGGGPVTVSSSTIEFGDIAITQIGTTDPAAQQVERAMLATLSGTATYQIEGELLTVTSEDGEQGLVFRAG